MTDTGKAYVARKPACGCIVAAVVDDRSRDTAKAVSEWIREGYVVDRVSNDTVRAEFMGSKCPHGEDRNVLPSQPVQMSLF